MIQVPGTQFLYRRGVAFYFYRRVPLDLVGKAGFGVHIKTSLKTKDGARAKELVRLKAVEADQSFAEARRRLHLTPTDAITPSEIQRLSAQWRRATLDVLLADPYAVATEDGSVTSLDYFADALRDAEDRGPKGAWIAVAGEVTQLLAHEGIALSRRSDDFKRLCDSMLRTYAEAFRLVKAIREHQPLDRETILGPDVSTSITVSDASKAFMAERSKHHRSTKTAFAYKIALETLQDIVGADTPLASIDRPKAREVMQVLASLPANKTKRFPGLSNTDAAAEARRLGIPPVAPKTLKNYHACISALFDWAVREEYIDRNRFKSLPLETTGAPTKRRSKSFTIEQLKLIFSAPLYTGCVDDEAGYATPGPNHPRHARFWVPLIGLWSGMRLNEICQLHVADVQEIEGVPCIIVSESEGEAAGDLRKRLKTKASERIYPVHSQLVKCGFLRFVEGQRQKGEVRLFPELKPRKSTGYLSESFSQWFRRFLEKLGIKVERQAFHAFRHTFRDAMREAGLSQDAVDRLGGWTDNQHSEARHYGDKKLARWLAGEVEKLRYEGLSLHHLAD